MILDRNGDPYGYFTRNKAHRNRTRIPWLDVALEYYGKTKNLDKTRIQMCSLSHHISIHVGDHAILLTATGAAAGSPNA
jgi:hypothetical protein